MTMGERIAALRKARGMTQENLAERLSVSRQSVSKWELDQATPEVGFAVALCEIFEVSLDYLIRGIEDEAYTEKTTPATDVIEQEDKIKPIPKAKPLTAKVYALLFGAILLIVFELFLHLLSFNLLLNINAETIGGFLVFLLALAVPLPVVYLATNHWCYDDSRTAFRHLWKITAAVALVSNLLIIGGIELYFDVAGLDYYFWQTQWEVIWYQSLVAELISLAILIPLLVRFHKKAWVCWVFYILSWVPIFGGIALQDLLTLPIHAGYYWSLACTGVRLLMVAAVILSQFIIYFCLPKETNLGVDRPLTTRTMWGIVAICSVAIPSVMGGLYYDLKLGPVGLPTAYLPLLYLPLPVLVLFFQKRTDVSTYRVWGLVGKTLGIFFPLMMVGHISISYFITYVLSYGHMAGLNWGRYILVSMASALVGGIITVPTMIALRKRPWLCLAVYGISVGGTVLATLLFPVILH